MRRRTIIPKVEGITTVADITTIIAGTITTIIIIKPLKRF